MEGLALDEYNIDSAAISVSGISSGAAFATQFHVAHAKSIMGVGAIAGSKLTSYYNIIIIKQISKHAFTMRVRIPLLPMIPNHFIPS